MPKQLRQTLRIIFSRPSGRSTPEAVAHDRYRRAILTTAVLMLARITNILIGFIIVPMTLHYLQADLFAVWMLLLSIVNILPFFDLGIGTGLRNMLIECAARNDLDTPRILIGNSLLILSILALLMIVFVYTILPLIPLNQLIKCNDSVSAAQILPAMQSVLVVLAIGLPINQLQNIANAYQRGYYGYFCFLLGRIFAYLFLIWCIASERSLSILAAGYVGIPFLMTLLGWVIFLAVAPTFRPWPISIRIDFIRPLFGIGFFVLLHHLSYIMINSSAIFLIAMTIDTSSSVPYAVTHQLLGVSNILSSSLMIGMSVAVADAWHKKQLNWIKNNIYYLQMLVVIFCVLPLFIFLLIGQSVIEWWTQSTQAVPSFGLLFSCILFACTQALGSIYINCLMAMNRVKIISICKFLAAIVFLPTAYASGLYFQSATAISFLQFSLGLFLPTVIFTFYFHRLVSTKEPSPLLLNTKYYA